MQHEPPTWLRRLAAATLLQALRDLRSPTRVPGIFTWLVDGGSLGDSAWTISQVLHIPASTLVECTSRFYTSGAGDVPTVEDYLRYTIKSGDEHEQEYTKVP